MAGGFCLTNQHDALCVCFVLSRLSVVPRLYVSLTTWLVLLVPALALTSPVGGPAVLYLSALIALTALAMNAIKHYEPMEFGALWPMSLALLLPLACMLLTSSVRGVWSNSELEKLLRFALALPVLWVLLRAPRQWLKHVQWTILAGALAGSALLIVTMAISGRGAMVEVGGRYNAVAFANMTLLFGGMTLLSLGWGASTRWPRIETGVKLLAVALTIYATWQSETRSSWMLLPILGLVFLLGLRNWRRRHKVYCALAVCVALIASAAAIWTFSSRMHEISKDLQGFSTAADRDTSFGIRLQLWHASVLMFEKSPIVGIGPSKFREELRELQAQGIVTQEVVDGFGEPHNDLLAALSGYGLLGFLSILALYLLPAAVFFRRLASDDRVIRVGAQLGLLFCLGYCAFSLTEMMFRNMRSVPTYSLIVVTLIALTTARPQRAGRPAR
jgi:O-antigen ligase